MAFVFTPAKKAAAKLRMALIGISGTGKTYSALRIATGMGGRIALIDTEHGRASAYAHKFTFDTLALDSFSPKTYIEAIHAAEQADYDVLIIDSLSHAWMGKDGALEQVDKAARAQRSQNTFTAWRDVTPLHNQLIEAITTSPLHIIATMRSKAKYDLEKDDKGKIVPRKIGMEPVQRDGMEYEFDLVGDLDQSHTYVISKSTLDSLHPQEMLQELTEATGQQILADITGQGTVTPQPLARTEPQPPAALKKMWTLLHRTGVENDDFRTWLLAEFGYESTKELSGEQIEYIIALVEHQGRTPFVPVPSQAEAPPDPAELPPFLLDVAPYQPPPDALDAGTLDVDRAALHLARERFQTVYTDGQYVPARCITWLKGLFRIEITADLLASQWNHATRLIVSHESDGGLTDQQRAWLRGA